MAGGLTFSGTQAVDSVEVSTMSASNDAPNLPVTRYSEADVPTEYGTFRMVVYREGDVPHEHVAIVAGDVKGKSSVLARVHSECYTGEVLHSLKCECREQLDLALRRIAERGEGVVLYLRQEGRGIGLGNKIRAYGLQQRGVDTVDANTRLGFEADSRRYHAATTMLSDLGVESVELMTNNPEKVEALRADGVQVVARVPHEIEPHDHNRGYLETKRDRMGHLLNGSLTNSLAFDAE